MRFAAGLAVLCGAMGQAVAAVAPDPTPAGPYPVRVGEYKLPATRDRWVSPFVTTELWARVYLPAEPAPRAHPLIVILHGNHATCGRYVEGIAGRVDDNIDYTTTGSCPGGYVVVPNHAGYGYMAEALASWGYAVVSINANRGVNGGNGAPGDDGLNIRRGRLVLRHLLQLGQWSAKGGTPAALGFSLRGQLDLGQIGLIGHSRGGEGMLAAVQLYGDAGSIWPELFNSARFGFQRPRFRAVFEIAPVDGQTSRVFSANNLPWSVLLPACDGDVSDLQGMRVFDRALVGRSETDPTMKAAFMVWGANHNFYNTEWQQSDSGGCTGDGNVPLFDTLAAESAAQRVTGLYPAMALFRSALGAGAVAPFAQLFDPAQDVPAPLAAITPVQRSFAANVADAGNLVVDEFLRPAGAGGRGIGNVAVNLDAFRQGPIFEHDPVLQGGRVTWSRPEGVAPSAIYLQSNLARAGGGKGVDGYATLDFRAGIACDDQMFGGCPAPAPQNVGGAPDFSVALVLADGRLSAPVSVGRYAVLTGPVGSGGSPFIETPAGGAGARPAISFPFAMLHPVLQSVRIPLGDFGLAPKAVVRGVRFTFDRTEQGAIYLANVRFGRPLPRQPDDGGGPLPLLAAGVTRTGAASAGGEPAGSAPTRMARLMGVRPAVDPEVVNGAPGAVVDIEVATPTEFRVKDALPVLEIGGVRLTRSRFAGSGPDRRVVFVADAAIFRGMTRGVAGTLRNGTEAWRVPPIE